MFPLSLILFLLYFFSFSSFYLYSFYLLIANWYSFSSSSVFPLTLLIHFHLLPLPTLTLPVLTFGNLISLESPVTFFLSYLPSVTSCHLILLPVLPLFTFPYLIFYSSKFTSYFCLIYVLLFFIYLSLPLPYIPYLHLTLYRTLSLIYLSFPVPYLPYLRLTSYCTSSLTYLSFPVPYLSYLHLTSHFTSSLIYLSFPCIISLRLISSRFITSPQLTFTCF